MLPLALAQAIAYIRNTGATISDFLEKFDEVAREDLSQTGKPTRIKKVFLDSCRQLPPDCIYVLMVMSRQPTRHMSLADLRDAVALKDNLESLETKFHQSFDDCLRKLESYSLIKYRPDEDDIQIHPLVAELCAEIPDIRKLFTIA